MQAARRLVLRPWVWVTLFAGYAALAAALRLASRDTVIADDAESFLWARALAWGYGPQPPLYAWLHWAVFQGLGETALASAVTHAIAQFTVPVGAFLLARRFAPVPLAGAATLAIFIVPEVGRAFPVTRTHNILATALTPLVVLTFLIWLEKLGRGRALLFGVVSALAILAKATATLVFVSLLIAALLSPATRQRIRPGQLALAMAAMALILLPPGLWLWQNADVGTASLVKFRTEDGALNGLYWLWDRMLASWGPTVVLAALAWMYTQGPVPVNSDVRLVWRMGTVALALILLGIVVSGAGDIREHWLAPIFLPLVPVTIALPLHRQGGARWLPTAVGGILAIVGLADLPSEIAKRGYDRLDVLRSAVAEISQHDPDLVLANRHAMANIVILNPALRVEERNDVRPVTCAGTLALVNIERTNDWPAPLDLDAFLHRLVNCSVKVIAERPPRPGPPSAWVSYAVLRLTPAP